MSYDLGAIVPLSIAVTDATGAPANAGAVTVTITLPDGTTSGPTSVSPASTGVYNYDYATTQAGRHVVRWVATGANSGAYGDMFEVEAIEAGQIVSLADTKAHLNIPPSRTGDDEELRGFILAATTVVERYAGAIVRTSHEQVFDGGREAVILAHTPVLSISSATESGAAVSASGYSLDAGSGVLARMSGQWRYCWQAGASNVSVSYVAGRTSVPPNVSRAALIVIKHMWETQRAAGGGRPGLGEEVAGPATYVVNPNAYTIPYRALELLGEPVSDIA